MALDDRHPQYINRSDDWNITFDVYSGERQVKSRTVEYLPPTEGMVLDGMRSPMEDGYKKYQGYLTRAVLPSYFSDAIITAVGMMHQKPATIELPKALEPLRENATNEGESLELLLRKMNEYQLRDGRLGILLDVPTGLGVGDATPFISVYNAPRIINWHTRASDKGRLNLDFVVLDESDYEMDSSFQWVLKHKYRVLTLDQTTGIYNTGVADSTSVDSINFIVPQVAGREMGEIPFVFVNATDLSPNIGLPPLLGLANLSLAIYRGEADYRQTLYQQAQETLVLIGGTEIEGDTDDIRAGSGSRIEVPIGGDAKYIGISAEGLQEMRLSLENDRDLAQQQGSRMLSTKGGDQQSGDALRTRVAAQTASLPLIAKTSAAALERILKMAASFIGANPDEVEVKPNLDFTADMMSGQDLLQIMQAKTMGAPLSNESLHRVMKDRGLTEKTLDEELDALEGESPISQPVRGVPAETGITQVNNGKNTNR